MIRGADFYKIGIVVDDLDEAVAGYAAGFDYEWRGGSALAQPFPVRVGDEVRTMVHRQVMSSQKPRIHLIEATPGTAWTVAPGMVHHLAYWVDDLQRAEQEVAALGYSIECGDGADDPAARMWGYYVAADGSRLELMRRIMPQAAWDAQIDSLPVFVPYHD